MSVRVLIVDDEPIARRRLKTLLQAEPSVEIVGESEDGESALAAIRRLRPDLVFLDVQMPGLDGFDVIELLSEAECPAVIFVTAYDQYAMRAFDVHAVDYLLKPFERGRLRKALARAAALAGRPATRGGSTRSSTRSAPTGRCSDSWSRRRAASTPCGRTTWSRWRRPDTTSSCAPRPAPILCATRSRRSSGGSTRRDSSASIARRS